ncbi:glycosyltransferase family 2 protein [Erythrobacter sp. HA6-11]
MNELSVVMVSYNTRDLTLKALETLFANAGPVQMRVVVWDNASADGSADAIAEAFPEIELIRSSENVGFAKANNAVIENIDTPYVLLLNPDTETHANAIANLLEFAKKNPHAGIVGGRTVFPDGNLNIASCWDQITLWSLFCRAIGLTGLFPNSTVFNPEAIGGWRRDSVRKVDIVVGCLLLTTTKVWKQLGGFRVKYFMFGEEADLCLRAKEAGYSPMITPDAQIMHLVGASYSGNQERVVKVLKGRTTLIRDHWPSWKIPLGLFLIWVGSGTRLVFTKIRQAFGHAADPSHEKWAYVWAQRSEWLQGY